MVIKKSIVSVVVWTFLSLCFTSSVPLAAESNEIHNQICSSVFNRNLDQSQIESAFRILTDFYKEREFDLKPGDWPVMEEFSEHSSGFRFEKFDYSLRKNRYNPLGSQALDSGREGTFVAARIQGIIADLRNKTSIRGVDVVTSQKSVIGTLVKLGNNINNARYKSGIKVLKAVFDKPPLGEVVPLGSFALLSANQEGKMVDVVFITSPNDPPSLMIIRREKKALIKFEDYLERTKAANRMMAEKKRDELDSKSQP